MEELIQLALECGADKAVVIEAERIVLSAEFRKICEGNGCGMFGRCWMCPPDVGEIGPLMDRVRRYSRGLLYQSISELEDSFDFEGMTAAGERHARLSQKIQRNLPQALRGRVLHLSCGGCRLCPQCAKRENLPCRHPDLALPSLESYGIDVYNTSKGTGLNYINGANTVTYFGMVLFEEREHGTAAG